MKKLIRITTVPQSLQGLLKGQLQFMSDNGFEVIGVSSAGKELNEIESNEGIRTLSIELTRRITPIKDLKALCKMYRFFRKEKPFIVHTHTPKAGTIGMLAALFARVPNRLHTIAGLPLLETTGTKRKLLNFVEKITYLCATKIYPNSYGLKEIILQNKFTKENKLKVIANGSSNGIDTQYFNPDLFSTEQKKELKKKVEIDEDDFVFIFVGRLVKDKGINELVHSFSILNSQFSICKLLLVGSFEKDLDPLSPQTLNEIENNKNIIFVGYQSDVRPYLAISNILTFPSYREGFPNVVMQAGAMGLPSIVTEINGCNEIVKEGVNGLIIAPKNEEVLKEKMFLLINDNELRNKLASNARAMITSRYEQEMVWKAILAEYKSLENYV